MPRPQVHANAAEKQRAYRQRLQEETVTVDRQALEALHSKLNRLQEAIADAAKSGDAQAEKCKAASVETMLEKLISDFEARNTKGQLLS
jgi:predicted  nucleic acid-binding Zn-ribbon protein